MSTLNMIDLSSQIKLFLYNIKYTTGIGILRRKALAVTKPTVEISVDGNNVTLVTKITVKTIILTLTLGEAYEHDPGTGESKKVIIFILLH